MPKEIPTMAGHTDVKRKTKFLPVFVYEGTWLAALFLLSNQRILVCDLNPACRQVNFSADYILWSLIVLVAFLFLARSGKSAEVWQAWKNNWTLGLFILYSMMSITWSIVPERSIHTVFIMVACSVSASILAVTHSPWKVFKVFFVILATTATASLLAVVFMPELGIHQDAIWSGAWRGIFDHKNDFGPLMALGNGLALIGFANSARRGDKAGYGLVYLLTFFLAVMSRSASAVVLVAMLNGFSLIYFFWIRWHAKFLERRASFLPGMVVAMTLLGPLSLVVVSAVMGKSLNLTGRIPLWINLLQDVVAKKPWFGYGLETLWYFPEFQKWASRESGWGDAIVVVNGHNGYMDILLYLGVFGLAILLFVLSKVFIDTTRRALHGRSWLDFYPWLMLVYFLTANLTVDYILEFESFHWMLLIAVLFLPRGGFTEQASA